AASRYRGEDIGVELTLNAEHDLYRWGPITHAPSPLDGDGGFPRTVADLWDHADLDEARRELRAQVERAIRWGFDVSHLDSHLGVLQGKPEFFDIYLDLAIEFDLPIRLPGPEAERRIGFPFRSLAAEEGIVFPDHFTRLRRVGSRRAIERVLQDLPPGVTEVHARPAIDTPELRAQTPDWPGRVDDHDLLVDERGLRPLLDGGGAGPPGSTEFPARPATDPPELRAQTPDWPGRVDAHDLLVDERGLRPLLDRVGAVLIGYRELRELQRSERRR